MSFPPHSLVNDFQCVSLNAKLLQVTLLHSLHCWITYSPFLTFICCLTLTILNNAIELGPRLSQERIINWIFAFKRFLKQSWLYFCIWLEFVYLCPKSEQCTDAQVLQAGIHFSCSQTDCEFVSYFSYLSRRERNLEHTGWLS